MSDRKMEEEGHADTDKIDESSFKDHKKERFVCPVCRRPLHKDNLVDVKSVVENNLCYVGGVLIVGRGVQLRCDFEHRFNKKEVSTDDPHKLVAVVDAEFDESGECVQFEIKEILAG